MGELQNGERVSQELTVEFAIDELISLGAEFDPHSWVPVEDSPDSYSGSLGYRVSYWHLDGAPSDLFPSNTFKFKTMAFQGRWGPTLRKHKDFIENEFSFIDDQTHSGLLTYRASAPVDGAWPDGFGAYLLGPYPAGSLHIYQRRVGQKGFDSLLDNPSDDLVRAGRVVSATALLRHALEDGRIRPL